MMKLSELFQICSYRHSFLYVEIYCVADSNKGNSQETSSTKSKILNQNTKCFVSSMGALF